MRSRTRDLQKVWFVTFEEVGVGMNTVKVYGNPIEKEMSVSATSGIPLMLGAGLSMKYNRYITCYDRNYKEYVTEGCMVFVDRVPILNQDGELIVNTEYERYEDGNIIYDDDGEAIVKSITYDSEPDYMVMEVYDTKRGNVARFGIKKA